jgi:hypothetical protein
VDGTCGTLGRGPECVNVLMGKPEGKRPLGRPRRRWEEGIRIYVGGLAGGVRIGSSWLRIRTAGGLL